MAQLYLTSIDNVMAEWSQGTPVCDERMTPFIALVRMIKPEASNLIEFTIVNDAQESYAVVVTDAVDNMSDQRLDFTEVLNPAPPTAPQY